MAGSGVFDIALFGAGRIGRVHAANIAAHPRSRLAMVADPAADAAEALAARHGAAVATPDEALAAGRVDAVVVASATATHADLVEAGIRAGKGVFCEKPIDLSLDRVDRTLAAVADRAEPLVIGFNRRFDPAIAELKRRLGEGAIGEPELVTVISKDPEAPPAAYLHGSGGLFRDMTIHDFDMARFLLGEAPVRVAAAAAALTDPGLAAEGDVDTASITLQTASGRIAVITNSRRAAFGYDQRVEVHGQRGTLRTENVPRTALVQDRADGARHEPPLHFFQERYAVSYAAEWDHFVAVLAGEAAPGPTGADGREALRLADAAYAALASGAAVEIEAPPTSAP